MKAEKIVVNKLNKDNTLDVQVIMAPQFHVRIWIAVRLIKLSGYVLGVDRTNVEVMDDE